MKTKKADEFVKRALGLQKTRFAVVGSGTSWTLYEGSDLPKAAAEVGPGEQLIKVNCARKSATQLQMAVIGAATELKIVKDKVFPHQVSANPKGFVFKTVSAQEDGALDAMETELDSTLAEIIGKLPAGLREELLPLYNEAKRFVEDGDAGQASARIAQLKGRLVTRNDSPQEAAARKKLLARLDGDVVEVMSRLPRDRRVQFQDTFTDLKRMAEHGDVARVVDMIARFERALAGAAAGGGARANGNDQPAQKAQPKAQPGAPVRTTADMALAQQQQLEATEMRIELDKAVKAVGMIAGRNLTFLADDLTAIRAEMDSAGALPAAQALATLRPLRARIDALHALAGEMNGLWETTQALQKVYPTRADDLGQRALKALATRNAPLIGKVAAELAPVLQRVKTEGPAKAAAAVQSITDTSDDALREWSPKQRCALLADLIQGGEDTKPARHAAISKLSKATDLDPRFEQRDREKRARVHAALTAESSGLAEARSRWDALPNPRVGEDGKLDPASLAKVHALEKALTLQCRELGIDPPPQIKLFSDPAAKVADKSKDEMGGYLGGDGHVYLNDASPAFRGDFDTVLDIVIHETTHKYQDKLKKDLQAKKIQPGDDDYDQAMLFVLNGSPNGYLPNGDGYVEQPVERHAWRAGLEARQLFATDEKAQAQIQLDRMTAWLDANGSARTAMAPVLERMRTALAAGSGKEIAEKTRQCQNDFEKVMRGVAQQAANRAPDTRTQARLLAEKMQTWVDSTPSSKARDNVVAMIATLTSPDTAVRNLGALLKTYPERFEMEQASIQA